jgi:hypothetical protein
MQSFPNNATIANTPANSGSHRRSSFPFSLERSPKTKNNANPVSPKGSVTTFVQSGMIAPLEDISWWGVTNLFRNRIFRQRAAGEGSGYHLFVVKETGFWCN